MSIKLYKVIKDIWIKSNKKNHLDNIKKEDQEEVEMLPIKNDA